MQLVKYEAAREALAQCRSADEVLEWANTAAATAAYARMAKDTALEADAAEIRIRAERRLGQMLLETKGQGKLKPGRPAKNGSNEEPLKLADIGVDKKLSARSQKLAKVPEAEFETTVDEWRERIEVEGARVVAKLEARGAQEPDEPEPESEEERAAELLLDVEAALRIIAADDKLAEAWALLKEEQAAHAVTRKLYEAQRDELAIMTKEAKRWMRKAESLEKAAKS